MERLALCATFVRYLALANRVQNTKPLIFLHYITRLNPIFVVAAALNNQSVLPRAGYQQILYHLTAKPEEN